MKTKTCCDGACRQGRDCTNSARAAIRWPLFCTRCGSRAHYAEDCKVPTLGMCDAERDMMDSVRRERNIVLALVALFIVSVLTFAVMGGPA